MRLELTGRHIKVTPALRALVEQGLDHSLRKLNSSALSVQVVLTQEKAGVRAEATLHVKGERFLHGEALGRDPQTAVAAVLKKVDSQAQKVKSKWSDGKRRRGPTAQVGADGPPAERVGGPRVIRVRRYPVKALSVDEAASVVGDTPNSFVLFRETESLSLTLVFRRPDGNIGLIEPES